MTILDTERRIERQSKTAFPRFNIRTELLPSAIRSLLCIYLLSIGAGCLFAVLFSVEPHIPVIASAILALIFGLALLYLPQHRHSAFGYANLVTSVRAAATSLVAATILFSDTFAGSNATELSWAVFIIVAVALILDGFDGYLARRFHHESEFGAKFDMEVDAFLILMLSCAALVLDKAGPWVLLIGAMRYLFVLAQVFVPTLSRPLAPSFRRKLVCVLQVLALGTVLVPIVNEPLSGWICAAALAALIYSFAVDVIALLSKPVSE